MAYFLFFTGFVIYGLGYYFSATLEMGKDKHFVYSFGCVILGMLIALSAAFFV